jgi:hypothetical protein
MTSLDTSLTDEELAARYYKETGRRIREATVTRWRNDFWRQMSEVRVIREEKWSL